MNMNIISFLKRGVLLILLFFCIDLILSLILLNGLNKFYGFNNNPAILINGSSMSLAGFNRREIENKTGKNVIAYNQEGASVEDRYVMIKQIYSKYPESIETVVYEINPRLLSGIRSAENVFIRFYPYMDDKSIRKYIKEQARPLEFYINYFIRVKRFESRLVRLIMLAHLGKNESFKTNVLDSTDFAQSTDGKTKIKIEESKINVFEDTMEIIRLNNSKVILVMMPMYIQKFNTFEKESYIGFCRYFQDFCAEHKNTLFLDLNQDSLIYNPSFFSDQLHFNVYGQKEITNIIITQLMHNGSGYN